MFLLFLMQKQASRGREYLLDLLRSTQIYLVTRDHTDTYRYKYFEGAGVLVGAPNTNSSHGGCLYLVQDNQSCYEYLPQLRAIYQLGFQDIKFSGENFSSICSMLIICSGVIDSGWLPEALSRSIK